MLGRSDLGGSLAAASHNDRAQAVRAKNECTGQLRGRRGVSQGDALRSTADRSKDCDDRNPGIVSDERALLPAANRRLALGPGKYGHSAVGSLFQGRPDLRGIARGRLTGGAGAEIHLRSVGREQSVGERFHWAGSAEHDLVGLIDGMHGAE